MRWSIGTDEICLEIYDLVSESKDTDYSLIKLNSLIVYLINAKQVLWGR